MKYITIKDIEALPMDWSGFNSYNIKRIKTSWGEDASIPFSDLLRLNKVVGRNPTFIMKVGLRLASTKALEAWAMWCFEESNDWVQSVIIGRHCADSVKRVCEDNSVVRRIYPIFWSSEDRNIKIPTAINLYEFCHPSYTLVHRIQGSYVLLEKLIEMEMEI